LTPEQHNDWNMRIRGEAVFLNGDQARIDQPDKLQTRVQSLHFGEPITISADEIDDGAETNKPKASGVDTDAKKVKVRTNLTYESILNAVKGEQGFVDVVLDGIKRRAAIDIEMLAFQGDTTLGGSTPHDKLLKRRDGWLKQARSKCRVLDAGGAYLSAGLLQEAVDMMPQHMWTPNTKWLWNKGMTGDFRRLLFGKNGGDVLAASLLGKQEELMPLGESLFQVPAIPNNMLLTTQDATPAQAYGTQYGPFVFTSSDNVLKLKFGATTKTITLSTGLMHASQVAKAINDAFGKRYARDWGGRLLLSTIVTGAASVVEVLTVANNAYTVLGLTVAASNGADADSDGQVYEGTAFFLADPSNFVATHPQRENRLTVKYDEDVDGIKVVMYDHWDFTFDDEDSIVMIDNVRKQRTA